MMSDIQIFSNSEFGEIRTVIIDGEPWFVGIEIANALGYAVPKTATAKRVEKDDRRNFQMEYAGQLRDMVVVNESGLYSLIFGSKLEGAKKFKRWVTSEVLPSIRKNGTYQMENLQDNPMKLLELHYEAIKQVDKKVDNLSDRIDKLEMDLPILPIEADKITEAVKKKGVAILGGKQSNAYNDRRLRAKLYNSLYANLKYNFGVKSYKSIKRSQCENAIEVIQKYEPPFFIAEQIENTNRQQTFKF
jgi:prophage antirepressor-like protein